MRHRDGISLLGMENRFFRQRRRRLVALRAPRCRARNTLRLWGPSVIFTWYCTHKQRRPTPYVYYSRVRKMSVGEYVASPRLPRPTAPPDPRQPHLDAQAPPRSPTPHFPPSPPYPRPTPPHTFPLQSALPIPHTPYRKTHADRLSATVPVFPSLHLLCAWRAWLTYYATHVRGYAVLPGVDVRRHAFSPCGEIEMLVKLALLPNDQRYTHCSHERIC